MNLFQVLAGVCSNTDLKTILSIIKTAITAIQWAIPIVLIILGTVDLSKAVIAQDDKQTKEAQKRFLNRVIYAVVIFLIPLIISLIFGLLPSSVFGTDENVGYNWKDCWDQAK